MSELWRYHSPDIYEWFETCEDDGEIFIYDERDPEYHVTHWLSAEEDDVLNLDEMI